MSAKRIQIFGISIDAVTLQEAASIILGWTNEKAPCRYVVTPNTDSIVLLHEREDFRVAYQHASLVVADGNPVLWAARILGKSLPERVAGSDLVPAVFDAAQNMGGLSVFLLGSTEEVLANAAQRIHQRWPWVKVCGSYCPPQGFEQDAMECDRILQMLSIAKPQILLLGVSSPKRELWVCQYRHRMEAQAALCVGAAVDFLAGEKKRAPLWMRKLCLEWLHRMIGEPRRLVPRYARDGWIFPRLLLDEWRKRKN